MGSEKLAQVRVTYDHGQSKLRFKSLFLIGVFKWSVTSREL